MGLFNDWKRRKKPDEKGFNFEFYEDTHDEYGEYMPEQMGDAQRYQRPTASSQLEQGGQMPFKMPDATQSISPRNYQNVVVYKPATLEDVQTLIDFLKRREPAIVNLDDANPEFSQRILDFISGAIYALSGSVHRIAGNIFLLSPEGVEITVPYERRNLQN